MNENDMHWDIIVPAVIGLAITLGILYEIIRIAVKAGTKDQTALIKKQNDMLLMMLNRQGVDKDELKELFVDDKKDIWTTVRNH